MPVPVGLMAQAIHPSGLDGGATNAIEMEEVLVL